MKSFTVEARGLTELRRRMRTLFDGDSRHIITYLNQRLGRYIVGALKGKPYPPELSGQKYERTGRLNRAWAANVQGRWDTIHITNNANFKGRYYAGYVVGNPISSIGNAQASIHRGRWWVATDVISDTIPQALEETGQYIESVWASV